VLLSCTQSADQNHDIDIPNRSPENLTCFRYCRTTVTEQNLIQEEIKRIVNSGNACCHSVHNIMPSCLPSKNVRTRIYSTVILLVVLYECQTCSLTVRIEHRSRIFEKRALRTILEWKRYEVTGSGR
jgi:hypothetical protein